MTATSACRLTRAAGPRRESAACAYAEFGSF